MPSRLIPAVAISLVLHAVVLFWDAIRFPAAPVSPPLQASLRLPDKPAHADDEPLLKNTLGTDPTPRKPSPSATPPAQKVPSPAPTTAKRQVEAAQRKLSQHLYYPPEAVARGIEGEVRLLLLVADDGSITDVSVAVSSGHAILDRAAVRAAYAMGSVNWAHSREMILPVIFRLE